MRLVVDVEVCLCLFQEFSVLSTWVEWHNLMLAVIAELWTALFGGRKREG